jgi:hypothetical protein
MPNELEFFPHRLIEPLCTIAEHFASSDTFNNELANLLQTWSELASQARTPIPPESDGNKVKDIRCIGIVMSAKFCISFPRKSNTGCVSPEQAIVGRSSKWNTNPWISGNVPA